MWNVGYTLWFSLSPSLPPSLPPSLSSLSPLSSSYLSLLLVCMTTGAKGYEGDGDITRLDNLTAFQQYVLEQTEGNGVHFVMADGVRIILVLVLPSVYYTFQDPKCLVPFMQFYM